MKRLKKWLCMGLAGVLTLGLCACNKGGEVGSNGGIGGKDGQGDNSASKQYVYAQETIDLGVDLENVGMYSMVCMDGRVYTVIEDYSNTMGGTVEPKAAVAEIDPAFAVEDSTSEESVTEEVGTEEKVSVEGDVSEEVPVTVEEYTGPNYYLLSVNVDGSDRKLVKLNLDETLATAQGYMSSFQLLKDGSVVSTFENYYEDTTDPLNPIYMQKYYLMRWDNQGNLLWTTDVSDENGNYFYIQYVGIDAEENLNIISGNNEMVSVDAQGNVTSRNSMENMDIKNMGQMVTRADGSMYITSYNDDWTKFFITTFDMATGELGEKIELPGNLVNYSIFAGTTTDLLLSNSFGLYTYNIGDAEPTKIMDFINSDIATYGLNNINILDDKTIIASFYDSVESKTKVAKFTYVDPKDIPDKVSITLGCNYLGYDVKKRVIDFNKTNSNYRITVKDYSSYNTMDDYTLAQTQMNNDIISGNMPDIMIVDSSQDISSWANKGLLADIGQLIEKDEELSQVEFLENVWEAFCVNDKLYLVVPNFSVQTMTARKDMVGDRTGWTMSEFMEFMASQEDDVKPFGDDMLRDGVLSYIMSFCGSDFVDVNTGQCNFNSEEFIAMLEFANSFPKDFPEDYWNDYDWESTQGVYREKKSVLLNTYISNISDLVYTIHGQLGSEAVFVGYPGIEGNSSVIRPASYLYAISAKSENIDGAWEFIRYYLTDEYQSSQDNYSLPVTKTAFEEKAKTTLEQPYWINEETGEKIEYNYTYYINGEEIILEPFSQAEVDEITQFIYSVNKRSYYNEEIINIVNEEAESFFSGQKTARDAAGIIQSRVQLYVDENR